MATMIAQTGIDRKNAPHGGDTGWKADARREDSGKSMIVVERGKMGLEIGDSAQETSVGEQKWGEFLVACTHIYKTLCQSVGRSIHLFPLIHVS